MWYFAASSNVAMEALMPEKVKVPESFGSKQEELNFWKRNSVSRSAQKASGGYGNMTRGEAQHAFHHNRADLFVPKGVETELYQGRLLREDYAEHRAQVRKIFVELNPWINHTGTKA